MDLNDLDDAEKFQKHFVIPVAQRIEDRLAPLFSRVEALEKSGSGLDERVKTLETYAKKLGTVYSGIIAVITFAVHFTWGKIKSKFNIT